MRKREMILVTAMMYVLCSGCSKTQQDNTAATITASYDEVTLPRAFLRTGGAS